MQVVRKYDSRERQRFCADTVAVCVHTRQAWIRCSEDTIQYGRDLVMLSTLHKALSTARGQ